MKFHENNALTNISKFRVDVCMAKRCELCGGSYMSEFIKQVWEKGKNARLCRAFYHFFAMCLMNLLIQEQEC